MAASLGPPKRRPGEGLGSKKGPSRPSETFLVGGRGRTSLQRGNISSLGISRLSHLSDRRSSSRSSVYGQGPSGYKKDPRPLSDKSHQQACIKKLCSFLVDRGYPRDVKPRTLQAPSTKEFLYMLNFILERIEPSLVINGIKLEEEIPFVLKFLGYPFPVSKNHLLSIGSPHSWPIMLGVLMWLIEGGYADETSDVMFARDGFDDNVNEKEIEFEQMTDLYMLYLEKGDKSEEFTAAIESRKSLLSSVIEAKMQQLSEETEQFTQLTSIRDELQKSSIGTLEEQLKSLKKEYEDCCESATGLVKYIEETEAMAHELHEKFKNKNEEGKRLKSHITELVEHIKSQPMSAKEAQELRQEIKEKQESARKMLQQREEALKRTHELQMLHSQSVFKIDEACQMVNNRLRELTAIAPDASCLPHLDYNVSQRADVGVLERLLEQNRRIKDGVLLLAEKFNNVYSSTERDVIELSSAISALENELVTADLRLKKTEATVERMKLSLKQAKQSHEEAVESDMNKKMVLENKLMELQKETEDRSVEEMMISETKRLSGEVAGLTQATKEKTAFLQELCMEMMAFIESEKRKDEKLCEDFEEVLRVFSSLKIEPIKRKTHGTN